MQRLSFILTLLFLCTFGFSYSRAGEMRTWTSGGYSVEGEFIGLTEDGTIVRIRKTNGKVTPVPLEKLSKEDQEYVKNYEENPFEKEEEVNPFEKEEDLLQAGDQKVLEVDGIKYAFRWCPPGEFKWVVGYYKKNNPQLTYNSLSELGMYHPENYESIYQQVQLTGFWMLETEVTQEMWQSVKGENPSHFKGDQKPVENVSWADCQDFCQKLSRKSGRKVQLPTEAQWLYAYREQIAGQYTDEDIDAMAWYKKNSDSMTHEVKQKEPNSWGLYDMLGNVSEWCSDYLPDRHKDYDFAPSLPPVIDPENKDGSYDPRRVVRGGNWAYDSLRNEESCSSADTPRTRANVIGLRIVLVPSPEDQARSGGPAPQRSSSAQAD